MSLPTVMITSEKAIQKSMTLSVRLVHQTSFFFLWALFQEFVRSTTPNVSWPPAEPVSLSRRS